MPELTWLQSRDIFYRYCLVQCIAQIPPDISPHTALERAIERAALATAEVFGAVDAVEDEGERG